jgi:hypothetical protein
MANRSRTKLDSLRLADLHPLDLIAPSFRCYELDRSEVALRLEIDNHLPSDTVLRAAVRLARTVMQPIREHYQQPISPTSLYRCQKLEQLLKRRPPGWVSVSPHTAGLACDLIVPGHDTLEVARWAADNLPDYDEIICERVDPAQGPRSGWVHIALRDPAHGPNRKWRQSEIYHAQTRRWVRVAGLADRLDSNVASLAQRRSGADRSSQPSARQRKKLRAAGPNSQLPQTLAESYGSLPR